MCNNWMRDNSGSGQRGRCGTGAKEASVELPNGFDMGCKRKREVKGNFEIFGLSN